MEEVDPWGKEARLIEGKWALWLEGYDQERSTFILEVIREGYTYIRESELEKVERTATPNYTSFTDNLDIIGPELEAEVAKGWIRRWPNKPRVVSARGAVPKKDSDKLRLITDLSKPEGKALNEHVLSLQFKLQTIDDALRLVKKDCWMAKVDLKAAYRHICIHLSNWELFGFEWKGEWWVDTRLCFGLNTAPWVFTQFNQALIWMAKKLGIESIVGYIDDFLIVANSKEECRTQYDKFCGLLASLGFEVAVQKCVPPAQSVIFLGIEIDSISMKAALPESKLVQVQ